MVKVCECCGQPLQDVREGIRLTPLKARIFDLIKARPGISRKQLCELIYHSVSEASMFTIGSHVKQIREKFDMTTTTIRATPHNGYRIIKQRLGQGLEKR